MLEAQILFLFIALDATLLLLALICFPAATDNPLPLDLDQPEDPMVETCRLIEKNQTSAILQCTSSSFDCRPYARPVPQRLSAIDVGRVCAALAKNSNVTHLSLRWASMRTVTGLAEVLSTSTSLRSLDLSNTGVRSAAFDTLVYQMAANSSLTALNVNGNPIADDGAQSIGKMLRTATCRLASLDVGRTGLTERGARHIAEALESNTTLTHLSMEWNRVHSVRPLSTVLLKNSTLQALHLGGGQVRGDAKAPLLSQVLQFNSSLKTLGLEWTALTDKGVAQLVEGLRANRTLTKLDLRGNEIREQGIELIAEAIQDNTVIASVQIPVFNANLTTRMRALIRFVVLCALDRGSSRPARLSSLPTDLLHSISFFFSFQDTFCTRYQIATLLRFVLSHTTEIRTALRHGGDAVICLVDGPQGLSLSL